MMSENCALPADTPCCALLYEDHRQTRLELEALRGLLKQGSLGLPGLVEGFRRLCSDLDRHFACEEHALFPVLSMYRPMLLMEVEHDDLLAARTTLEETLKSDLERKQPGEELQRTFQQFEKQLFAHMKEEDEGIFTLAERTLEPEEKVLVYRKLCETNVFYARHQPSLERPEPTFKTAQTPVFEASDKPIRFETLFEAEHTSLQNIRLAAGQSTSPHWVAQHQCLLVLSGEVLFKTEAEEARLVPGMQVKTHPRLWFSLLAITDASLLAIKVWPRPNFLRT